MYVVHKTHRRVCKWYHDEHERLQNEVDRELAEHLERHLERPVPRALETKQNELEALRAALDERLAEEKAEATRRVIPLILPARGKATRSTLSKEKRRGTFSPSLLVGFLEDRFKVVNVSSARGIYTGEASMDEKGHRGRRLYCECA